ncbi:exopolysaccharide biosynthesis protein [Suicoccus acidiformans]|uniref:Tyrosine-protein kinase CpsD n=1 Tax=Suicoccus acidiformans TaxID=2036206 RepID=A0A347WJN6_9LACT|nr:CpsD/CapB family tyrosine-protein kinase [Suicoccus acidiformans]AXY25293.1 exopolysaccharide biosynthesis protein [Suicoccus acidiformans]
MDWRYRRKRKEERLMKEQAKGAGLITYFSPQSVQAEQLRTIRTNIQFAQMDQPLQSIVITSSIPAEGKSTIAANLAFLMGTTDQRVLIVDADMRKPTLHKTFTLSNEQGLTGLLLDRKADINDYILRSPELNLYLLPSGPIPPNPSELLSSGRMTEVMHELKHYFDIIIYDVPPLTAVTDAQIMANKVDGTVLVVRADYVHKSEVRKSVELLNNVNANIIGYVMNGVARKDGVGYGYGYGYGYSQEDTE